MINDKEKKMIQRYCIYPKIAVVALIFSFVQCALIVPLEMIDDLVFQNKGFQPTGMFTALGFVIIYVVIFCFCALAPKFGMNGKKWKSLIGRLNVKQSETDYSKEVAAALASQAVGRFLKESDNDTAKNIGSAMQVAGAVSTVSTSIDMLSEAGSNAENMAHAYRIPIPDIKKQLIAFAVIPILIVVGTYIPQYIKGKQAMDQRIAASAKQVEIVKKALEPVCVRVHADNPNESRSRSSYTVMGYLRDSGATDCYVHVQVNNSGTNPGIIPSKICCKDIACSPVPTTNPKGTETIVAVITPKTISPTSVVPSVILCMMFPPSNLLMKSPPNLYPYCKPK